MGASQYCAIDPDAVDCAKATLATCSKPQACVVSATSACKKVLKDDLAEAFEKGLEPLATGLGGAAAIDQRCMRSFALLKGARDGNVEAVKDALEEGAFIETRRPFIVMVHSTPASPDGSLFGAKSRGAGLTPLMYASQGGYCDVIRALIAHGADVNSQDEDGLTPLHFAAHSGVPEACVLLLRAGGHPSALDDSGFAPLEHVPEHMVTTKGEMRQWQQVFSTAPDKDVEARMNANMAP
eukprot:TRINITY_DN25297_c0_g1_i1.p1 TRINITY_DN25297_c0_g1~~TRINITY_DN25297_c0_g1_i1.p1  ORF type:complete len:239 (+),score=33.91 TRINITY_DN25297_c0_g1_i1:97-813(+)